MVRLVTVPGIGGRPAVRGSGFDEILFGHETALRNGHHAAAAFYNHFVRKDGMQRRMKISLNPLVKALDMISASGNDAAIHFGLGGGDIMKFQKLFCDDNGESHWEDVDITLEERSFAPPAQKIEVSERERVKHTMFLRLRSGWNEPIHPTPVMQKLVCLAGTVRVTASDSEFRDIGPGDVWHMEDKRGKGHHTVVTSTEDFEALIIQYE